MRKLGRVQPGTLLGTVALVMACTGGAYAAAKIGTDDIESKAVTGSKIAPDAIKGSKVKDNAISGQKVDESTLGQVPSAQRADVATTAQGIEGENEFFIKMDFGQQRVIGAFGSVSLTASCERGGGNDTLNIYAYSELDSAMLKSGGGDNLLGPGSGGYLGPNTPGDQRQFETSSAPSSETQGFFELDGGWVADPNEHILAIDTETLFGAVNYYGAGCVLAGELQTYRS